MAKQNSQDTVSQFNSILSDIRARNFRPVYVFMGEEPYYSDVLVDELLATVLKPEERDFNQTIVYGSDTNPAEVVSLARRFPMFSDYQLVIVKEAQNMGKGDALEIYLQSPAPETVLVLSYTGKSIDKRSSLYKKLKSCKDAVVMESVLLQEWKVGEWIVSHIKSLGYTIGYDAAQLMAEHTGNSLRKIVLEIDKLIKSLPDNSKEITSKDIEENIGISREFSAFELCRAISYRDKEKAFKIAHFFGENSKKYPLALTLGALFFYISRLLKAYAYLKRDGGTPEGAAKKAGAFGTQEKEYATAIRNYSYVKVMGIVAQIKDCDYKFKSGNAGTASEGELLIELISHIFN
ncbi:MAG: DNA polymerase III subunit delta [Bacteroidales bacterium]|nr:DNA polymerase III subunit delta [Bacteroidales bacterium]